MVHEKGDEVYVVVIDEWDRGVYRSKIEEVRDYGKYLIIMDMRYVVTIKNVYTKREIVSKKIVFKNKEEAEKYYESVLRDEIEDYKSKIKNVGELVDFCLKYNVAGDLDKRLDTARLAVIERKVELGVGYN